MKLSLKYFVTSTAILLGLAIIIFVQILSEGSKSLNTPVEKGGPGKTDTWYYGTGELLSKL